MYARSAALLRERLHGYFTTNARVYPPAPPGVRGVSTAAQPRRVTTMHAYARKAREMLVATVREKAGAPPIQRSPHLLCRLGPSHWMPILPQSTVRPSAIPPPMLAAMCCRCGASVDACVGSKMPTKRSARPTTSSCGPVQHVDSAPLLPNMLPDMECPRKARVLPDDRYLLARIG